MRGPTCSFDRFSIVKIHVCPMRTMMRRRKIDLCFVGLLHSDRLEMIRRLQEMAQSQGISFFVYLYTGLYTSLKLARANNAKNIHFRPLSYRKLMELNRRTAVILDLPHAAQSGLTMRAIEAVGLGKKLITTASDVVHYDFFSIDNVQLLRSDDLRLDRGFICKPPAHYPEAIRHRYSLDAWLEDVFRLTAVGARSMMRALFTISLLELFIGGGGRLTAVGPVSLRMVLFAACLCATLVATIIPASAQRRCSIRDVVGAHVPSRACGGS